MHRELLRPNVTLMLLWEECCDANSHSFSYSWFCERYREWAGRSSQPSASFMSPARSCPSTIPATPWRWLTGSAAGALRADLVAVLGASNYTYAEASLTQSLPDWIASHVRAFLFFGGTARQTVSDNLKAGITRACFHEPMVNRTYADLAHHYRTAIVPARPYRPRDKAKVEVRVQIGL